MEFILAFVFLVAACNLLYLLFKKKSASSNREKFNTINQKIDLLESKNVVVEVKPSLKLDKELLLGFFVIPHIIYKEEAHFFGSIENLLIGQVEISDLFDRKTAKKLQVILPNITTDGELYYEYNWIPITSVKIPKKEAKSGEERVRLEAAEELIKPIIEHLQVKSELKELNEQYQELKELFNLVSTSEFYADQKSLYKRGLAQIKELITKAENLEKTYYKLIREVLIGIRLAKYDPSKIPDRHIALDSQYQEIKEEYEHMKDTATAYNELVNNRQI